MMPMRTSRALRAVRPFDLITPAGQVYRFPKSTWFQRTAAWLSRSAEPIILSVVVMGLVCTAGFLAEALESTTANNCVNQLLGTDTPA